MFIITSTGFTSRYLRVACRYAGIAEPWQDMALRLAKDAVYSRETVTNEPERLYIHLYSVMYPP